MSEAYSVEIIDSQAGLSRLEAVWEQLLKEDPRASIYSSHAFVSAAWKHFSSRRDRLFVLVFRRGAEARAIAPLVITTRKIFGMVPYRIIRYIAEWGNGDCPRIVAAGDEEEAWGAIARYLERDYRAWDGIELAEQSADSAAARKTLFDSGGFLRREYPATVSYYTALSGSWDSRVRSLRPRVRDTLRKCSRRIEEQRGKPELTVIGDASGAADALRRFTELEQSGWKKNRSFSVGGTPRQRAFHAELIDVLAKKGMVIFYFLSVGSQDIAGSIVYRLKDTLYSAYVAYHPAWAVFSPGVLLRARVLEQNFTGQYRRLDYLGFGRSDSGQSGKRDWSTGMDERVHVNYYTISVRSRCYRLALFLSDFDLAHMRVLVRKIMHRVCQNRSAYLLCRDMGDKVDAPETGIPVTVRQMTPGDLPALDTFQDEPCAQRFRTRLDKGKIGFVAESDGRIVHYSWVSFEDDYESWSGRWVRLKADEAYVYDGYTAPEARGKRVYPAVLSAIADYAGKQGKKRVFIMIGKQNSASLQSARRAGFRVRRSYINLRVFGAPVRLWSRGVQGAQEP